MRITLLHGALGAGDQLTPLAEELEKSGFDTVALELPGHGESPLNGNEFTIKGYVHWLEKMIKEKGLQNDPFFGFSMGGYIALTLCGKNQMLKNKIITLGTKFNWSKEEAANEVKKLNPEKILEKVPKFAEMLNDRHADWKEVLKNTATLMTNLGEQPLLNEDVASKIKNEVLIMRGEADLMVTKEESMKVASWLPKGEYKELPAIPHPLEQVPPAQVVHEIKGFLA